MRRVTRPYHVYYTDGSCHPNPGPGGYAVVRDGRLLASGSEPLSTNQRMELAAMLAALRLIAAGRARYPRRLAEIRSDSQYAINCTGSAAGWKKNGWRRANSGPLKNLDLIQQLYAAYNDAGTVKLTHVRGHKGIIGNEMADHHAALARLAGILVAGEGGDAC